MAFFAMTFETSSVCLHTVCSWARSLTNSTSLSWNEDVHVLHVPRLIEVFFHYAQHMAHYHRHFVKDYDVCAL